MPTEDWDTLAPTDGTPGNSYEYGLDVKIGAAWVNVPDITALNPAFSPRTRNRASYAAKAKARPNTYARDLTVTVNVEVVRDALNQYQEELQYLLDVAALLNADNRVEVRIFDTLGADWAWQMEANVEHNRPQTGDDEPGWFGFTLASYGGAIKIPNPVTDDLLPGIISVLPLGQSVGETVVIHGLAFTGATAVSIDGVAAFSGATIIDDRNISVEIPTGASGSSAIIVTTPAGASSAFTYVVGA